MKKTITFLLLTFVLVSITSLNGLATEPEDKTLSPYFFVQSDNPEVDQLPLKSTNVSVNVSGVMANVTVAQTYKNEGTTSLEAIYVFPASTKAAVHAMKMTIGERTIIANVAEREAARKEYEAAKNRGKSASLLEQHRPNVFQMNVANILPEDVIVVEMKYTELLVPENAEYQFVYPTVVGPRYVDSAKDAPSSNETWTQNPYLHEGEAPTSTFDLNVFMEAGLPIQEITCSSHKVAISYNGPTSAEIALDSSETHGGNRDYILKYRLAGNKIQTGLLLFEGEKENHFLLMVQPPKRVKTEEIPPREYIFIVDVSGSMHGFPFEISKKLLKDLLGNLRPTDRFNVLLFAGSASTLSEHSLPATEENLQRAIIVINNQLGGGGTRLLPALQKAFSLPGTEGFSRNIIIATDGYVAVEKEAFDLIRNQLGNANVFSFGIGSSVNRHLIEGMARVGMGEPYVITDPKDAPATAEKFRKLIQTPALTNIHIDWNGFDVYDIEPPAIPDVMADRPVIVFGKWRGRPNGTLQLKGRAGNKTIKQRINVSQVRPSPKNASLRYLWARHRIAVLSDYNALSNDDGRVEEITRLGLSYNLLTAYTSFIAVDSVTGLKDGKAVTVNQPLPLPQGVSDHAVGRQRFAAAKPLLAPSNYGGLRVKSRLDQEIMAVEEDKKEAASTNGKRIRLLTIEKDGGYSKEELKRIITAHLEKTNQACGTLINGIGPFSLTIAIDASGKVQTVTLNNHQKIDAALLDCLKKSFKEMQFPASKTGKKSVLSVTFDLI
jgi:Ca-activated chloride channel homolog